jgi:hypothetical protein
MEESTGLDIWIAFRCDKDAMAGDRVFPVLTCCESAKGGLAILVACRIQIGRGKAHFLLNHQNPTNML